MMIELLGSVMRKYPGWHTHVLDRVRVRKNYRQHKARIRHRNVQFYCQFNLEFSLRFSQRCCFSLQIPTASREEEVEDQGDRGQVQKSPVRAGILCIPVQRCIQIIDIPIHSAKTRPQEQDRRTDTSRGATVPLINNEGLREMF